MGISSISEKQKTTDHIKAIIADMLPDPIVSISWISGGANSQVYLLECEDSKRYVAKLYFRHGDDKRNRIGVEYEGLSFLRAHGVDNVPQPVAVNKEALCAIYSYIDGDQANAKEIEDQDIDCVVGFLAKLKALRSGGQTASISPASEACFSAGAIVKNIESRLSRFDGIEGDSEDHAELYAFLNNELKPVFDVVKAWCKDQYESRGLSFDADISQEERILSPSDFGFHNARRDEKGNIIFFDFEYFGWDDPAKTISDFLLHPAMDIGQGLKERFLKGVFDCFSDQKELAFRTACLYPLFGLKWCLIFLNEFIPQDLSRRDFANNDLVDKKKVRKQQLAKAQNMLSEIRNNYRKFPCYD